MTAYMRYFGDFDGGLCSFNQSEMIFNTRLERERFSSLAISFKRFFVSSSILINMGSIPLFKGY